jgi:hypothetical protein
MLTMPVRKPMKNQLYFDFAHAEKQERTTAQRSRKKPISRSLSQEATPPKPDNDLLDLCVLLHTIARKSVSATNFHDFNLVARCTKLLQTLGVLVEAPAEMQAVAADQEAALVLSAPEYRLLRSRAVAGLATVADLADRPPAKGSAEYQRGMRDAYQHASDIAALFLDDLEQFQTRLRKPW